MNRTKETVAENIEKSWHKNSLLDYRFLVDLIAVEKRYQIQIIDKIFQGNYCLMLFHIKMSNEESWT